MITAAEHSAVGLTVSGGNGRSKAPGVKGCAQQLRQFHDSDLRPIAHAFPEAIFSSRYQAMQLTPEQIVRMYETYRALLSSEDPSAVAAAFDDLVKGSTPYFDGVDAALKEAAALLNKQRARTAVMPVPEMAFDALNENIKSPWTLQHYGERRFGAKYKDATGAVLFCGVTFEREGEFSDHYYFYADDGYWHEGIPLDDGRPLYCLPEIMASTLPIVVVHGGRDAACVVAGYVVTTFAGGSSTATDWALLADRDVTIWPASLADMKSAVAIQRRLPHARILETKGKSVADVVAEGENPAQIAATCPAIEMNPGQPVHALGYDHGIFYFQSARNAEIIALSAAQLNTNGLLMLAPLLYWQMQFPNPRGVDLPRAADALIQAAVEAGPFSPEKVITNGAFENGGRFFYHYGDRVRDTELREVGIETFTGRIIERGRTVDFSADPLRADEGAGITDSLRILAWVTPSAAVYVAGWLYLANLAGVIPWRPHLWILGPSGVAKSTMLKRLMAPVLGQRGISFYYFKGDTTAAGVRQSVGTAATGVIWDEVECDEIERSTALDGPLHLMRSASSADDGAITKGTTSGRAQATIIRVMFCFASTTKVTHHEADQSRIVPCRLKKVANGSEVGRRFRASADALCKNNLAARLRSRALKLLPQTLEAIRVFSDEVADILADARQGDLLGSLLAGAWMLEHDSQPGVAQAREFALQVLEAYAKEYTKEPSAAQDALAQILHATVRLPQGERSIIELIDRAADPSHAADAAEDSAVNILRRVGIMVGTDNGQKVALFSCRHGKLADLAGRYRETYAQRLSEVPGVSSTPRKIEGRSMRFIAVPIEIVRQYAVSGEVADA